MKSANYIHQNLTKKEECFTYHGDNAVILIVQMSPVRQCY